MRGNIDVLEDVLDKESGQKPKLTTARGGVASAVGVGTVRHLIQDDLEAFLQGRLASSKLDFCQTHLDSCDACRAELEDLRTFRSNAASMAQSGSLGRELDRRRRQRRIKTALTGTAVTVIAGTIVTAGWWQYEKWRVSHAASAGSSAVVASAVPARVAEARTMAPAGGTQAGAVASAAVPQANASATPASVPTSRARAPTLQPASVARPATAQGNHALASQPTTTAAVIHAVATPAVVTATQSQALHATAGSAVPHAVAAPAGGPPQSQTLQAAGARAAIAHAVATPAAGLAHSSTLQAMAHAPAAQPTAAAAAAAARTAAGVPVPAAAANTTFALLGPFGDNISDTRPEFSWQPLAGATHYSVVIVDAGLHPINRSHALKTTSWRPRKPLHRGRTYLWQVTATLRNGKKVVASEPSASEARVMIAPTPTSD